MSVRTSLLRTVERIRGIPGTFGVHTTSVTIRRRTWIGGRIGASGGYTDVDMVLAPVPHVAEVSQREIAGAGGRYEAGDVRVGPITPAHRDAPGVGYTQEQLAPTLPMVGTTPGRGVEIIYVLNGGITGEYSRVDMRSDRAFRYMMTLRRRRTTP